MGRVGKRELEKIENAVIFDRACEEDFNEKFLIFGCSHPAVAEKARVAIDLNNLVFLRQKNPSEKARLILNAYKEIAKINYSYIDIPVGDSLLAKTDDFELASILSMHFSPLYVVTRNKEISDVGIAIDGEIKEIQGNIGDFIVKLDGVDLRTGKRVGELKVAQIFIPGIKDERDGIYSSERRVLEAIYNKGGILKVKAINYSKDRCGASFNGISGCKLCRCNHGFVGHGESVRIDLLGCYACGLCASLCPSDSLRFEILPREVIIKMIDIFSEYRGRKTILFACKNAIAKVYGNRKTETFFPIILPCINALSEVEILYPLLRGFSGVYILPCNCRHGKFDGANRAMKIAEHFGIECIVLEDEFRAEVIKKLNTFKPVSENFEFKSEIKRKQLIEILSFLKSKLEYDGEKIDLEGFGYAEVSESCTLCRTCSTVCFMDALRRNNGKLEFQHGLCVDCGLCMIFCPENAIRVENGLYIDKVVEKVILREEKMIRCPECGKEHISEKEYRKISSATGYRILSLYCSDCRAKMIFEGIYKEMEGVFDEGNKRNS